MIFLVAATHYNQFDKSTYMQTDNFCLMLFPLLLSLTLYFYQLQIHLLKQNKIPVCMN